MYDFEPEKLLRLVHGTFTLAIQVLFTRLSKFDNYYRERIK